MIEYNDVEDKNDFEVVEGFVPQPRRSTVMSARAKAVLSGKTIFIPGMSQNGVASRFSSVRARGLTVHSQKAERNGLVGIYVWAEQRTNGQ